MSVFGQLIHHRSDMPAPTSNLSSYDARSKSSPQAHKLNSNVTLNGIQHDVLAAPAIAEPAPSRRRLQRFDCDEPAEQRQPDQRPFFERGRSFKRNSPPFITEPASTAHRSNLDSTIYPIPQLGQFPLSPPRSRDSSPTKPVGKLSDWFNGESLPINISIIPSPSKEKTDDFENMTTSSNGRPVTLAQRISIAPSSPRPGMSSRFSFFSNKASSSKPPLKLADFDDEFLDLDINKALFPAGNPDPFSPVAFKNLLQNADGLLSRVQAAYKERTTSLREITAEKETQAEELEGTQTRARYLKIQLDDLASKMAEQDQVMMNLVDDLAREKLSRREEDGARKRSVMLIRASKEANTGNFEKKSRPSMNSDWGCASEDHSFVESVFSKGHGASSPAMSMSSMSTANSPDSYHQTQILSDALGLLIQSGATPQHITKGISTPFQDGNHSPSHEDRHELACANCQGLAMTEAWSVVTVLKEENKALKERVIEVEEALDGCLDMVGRVQ